MMDALGIEKISAIPNSSEKFMSFTIGDLRFLDSFQFMSTSLSKLVENLYDEKDKYKNFKFMNEYFSEHMDLLCRKGIYPYEWANSLSKVLNYVGLPPIECFKSKLTKEETKKEDYEHALNVYHSLGCKKFLDYHLTYLKCDVLLLADVFENFRKKCYEYYKLDPANYYSAPGLAWDAMLLKTGIKLDLITDLKMLEMIERMKRGGLCYVGSKRHVKANNKYLDNYDSKEPSSYIMYWDANNLYGWAMVQSLPYKNLRFCTDSLEDILKTEDDADEGYIVECDLRFPKEIHNRLKEYPPCPETMKVNIEWFSEYQKKVGELTGIIKIISTMVVLS
jgi:hypothetical protein